MPTITTLAAFGNESDDRKPTHTKNSGVRSERRAARRDSQGHATARSGRGRERRLSVRGELRAEPDVRKIARAVIQLAMAQAEADAEAARQVTDPDQPTNPTESGDV